MLGKTSNNNLLKELGRLELLVSELNYGNYNLDYINSCYHLSASLFREINNSSQEKKTLNLLLSILIAPYIIFFSLIAASFSKKFKKKDGKTDSIKDKFLREKLKNLLYLAVSVVVLLITIITLSILLLPATIFAIIFYSSNRELTHNLFRFLFKKDSLLGDQKIQIACYSRRITELSNEFDLVIDFPVQYKKLVYDLLQVKEQLGNDTVKINDFVKIENGKLKISFSLDVDGEFKEVADRIISASDIILKQGFLLMKEILSNLKEKNTIQVNRILRAAWDEFIANIDHTLVNYFFDKVVKILYAQAILISQRADGDKLLSRDKLIELLVYKKLLEDGKVKILTDYDSKIGELKGKSFCNTEKATPEQLALIGVMVGKKEPTYLSTNNTNIKSIKDYYKKMVEQLEQEFEHNFKNNIEKKLTDLLTEIAIGKAEDLNLENALREIIVYEIDDKQAISLLHKSTDSKWRGLLENIASEETKTASNDHKKNKYVENIKKEVAVKINKLISPMQFIKDNIDKLDDLSDPCINRIVEEERIKVLDSYKISVMDKIKGINDVQGLNNYIQELRKGYDVYKTMQVLCMEYNGYMKEIECVLEEKKIKCLLEGLKTPSTSMDGKLRTEFILSLEKKKAAVQNFINRDEVRKLADYSGSPFFKEIYEVLSQCTTSAIVENIDKVIEELGEEGEYSESFASNERKVFQQIIENLERHCIFFDMQAKFLACIIRSFAESYQEPTLEDYKKELLFIRDVKYQIIKQQLIDNFDLHNIKNILLQAEYQYLKFTQLLQEPLMALNNEACNFCEQVLPEATTLFINNILRKLTGSDLSMDSKLVTIVSGVCRRVGGVFNSIKVGTNILCNTGVESKVFESIVNMLNKLSIIAKFFNLSFVDFQKYMIDLFSDKTLFRENICPMIKENVESFKLSGIKITSVVGRTCEI